MLEHEADIVSSLHILLSTARGERIMVPQYGCNMDELVFENLDTRMRTLMADKIESAILYHEPRIDLERVQVDDDPDDDARRPRADRRDLPGQGDQLALQLRLPLLPGRRHRHQPDHHGPAAPGRAMTSPCADCSENTDPLKLVREGTHQVQRLEGAPDPARVPVDERRPEHAMVFASAYSAYLRYFDLDDVEQGTWQDFFASDVSAQLAVVAVEDVAVYRTTLKALLRSLEDPELPGVRAGHDRRARRGVRLPRHARPPARHPPEDLPNDQPLRATLGNLIRSQLSPMLRRLIGYYLAGDALGVVDPHASAARRRADPRGAARVVRRLITGPACRPSGRRVWTSPTGPPTSSPPTSTPYKSAYGPSATPRRPGQPPRHPQPLHGDLRDVPRGVRPSGRRGQGGRRATFEWNGHEPHYALFLAFLQLLEYARDEANGLTAEHLDFYYRDVLR